MTSSMLISLCLFVCLSVAMALPFYSKRELAPSLTLHRINALKDTIDQLNDIQKAIRCREKAAASRSKRMISPSLRLSELIDPLVVQGDSAPSGETQVDECVGFYHDIPYYF